MTLSQAKALIKCDPLNAPQPQTWFDLGCGSGLFTEALNGLLPEGSLIYAIDKQATTFTNKDIKFLQLDFVNDPLPKVAVNGILMANSLHYVKDKLPFLSRVKNHLGTKGVFLLVEYDIETSNQWVPYPMSFLSARALSRQAGFESFTKINDRPSIFRGRRISAALLSNEN